MFVKFTDCFKLNPPDALITPRFWESASDAVEVLLLPDDDDDKEVSPLVESTELL